MSHLLINSILAEFGLEVARARVERRSAAGGFSGAEIWKVETDGQNFCLRKWPRQLDLRRLELIHRSLLHASQKECDFLPVPRTHIDGTTHCRKEQHIWELTTWMPGQADFWHAAAASEDETASLRIAKLKNAAMTLARFHLAVADLMPISHRGSPSVITRLSQLRQWMRQDAENIRQAVAASRSRQLEILKEEQLANDILDGFKLNAGPIEQLLSAAIPLVVPLQICIKDIWHDHVLFTGEQVTGVVDFGAMSIDTVACDIARLFGSLIADDSNMWAVAINAYETVRPLQANERRLIKVFDRSTTLMSGMNWLNWIFLENREFEDLLAVRKRLLMINERLQNLGGDGLVLE